MSCPLKALADPTRQAILRSLRAGPLPVESLEALTPGSAGQLGLLRRAGLLREEWGADGRCYALERRRLHELATLLQAIVQED